jgi:excisionase family DNA binding protein
MSKPSNHLMTRMLTVANVADRLQVSAKTVRRMIQNGEIRVHHVGRQHRISEDDLMLYLVKQRS